MKIRCKGCNKRFGGERQQLVAIAACPKCRKDGEWWLAIETRASETAGAGASKLTSVEPELNQNFVPAPRPLATVQQRERGLQHARRVARVPVPMRGQQNRLTLAIVFSALCVIGLVVAVIYALSTAPDSASDQSQRQTATLPTSTNGAGKPTPTNGADGPNDSRRTAPAGTLPQEDTQQPATHEEIETAFDTEWEAWKQSHYERMSRQERDRLSLRGMGNPREVVEQMIEQRYGPYKDIFKREFTARFDGYQSMLKRLSDEHHPSPAKERTAWFDALIREVWDRAMK